MERLAFFLPFAAAALLAAGCGGDSDKTTGAAAADGAAMEKDEEAMKGEAMEAESTMSSEEAMEAGFAMSARGTRVKLVDSDYGRVIADGKGEAFYLFDKEERKKAECYGACAQVWPPVLTKGKPKAAKGVKQGLLGTTRRSNGKLQVTYTGHPLYYYVDDSPGTILCHDVEEFSGLWLVVKPDGKAA